MKSKGPQSSSCLAEPRKENKTQPALNHSNLPYKLSVKILSRKPFLQTHVRLALPFSNKILSHLFLG